jgi:hypothetical protein
MGQWASLSNELIFKRNTLAKIQEMAKQQQMYKKSPNWGTK